MGNTYTGGLLRGKARGMYYSILLGFVALCFALPGCTTMHAYAVHGNDRFLLLYFGTSDCSRAMFAGPPGPRREDAVSPCADRSVDDRPVHYPPSSQS